MSDDVDWTVKYGPPSGDPQADEEHRQHVIGRLVDILVNAAKKLEEEQQQKNTGD